MYDICPHRILFILIIFLYFQMSDDELTALVMQRVACLALPGRKVPLMPVRIVRTRWAQDPYARGVYSHWAVGNRPGTICSVYQFSYSHDFWE